MLEKINSWLNDWELFLMSIDIKLLNGNYNLKIMC